ncbi:MAG TPA: TonB-dependent receptor [Opitutaceae bacterium]|jgi:iron complex outermembrane receptor protein
MNLNLTHLRICLLGASLAVGMTGPMYGGTDAVDSVAAAANDEPVRLDEVEVFAAKTDATTQAITDSKLDVVEPDTFISAQTINNLIAPTADYATIANLAPSTVNVETEGPGLSESKMLQMRGFTDGQYNVTYDGIPFGDANGATHHTTSYFPAKVLGGVDIDRGPGTAATIGENTFGGTIGLLSKDPRPDQAVVLTLSDGSYDTFLGNLEVNTGDMPALNNGSLVLTYQYLSSDGYRTDSYENRNTYYAKYVQPLGPNTTLTIVGNYNNIKFNNPGTVTWAQINTYGRNFGLDANPFDPNNDYYAYNWQQKQADMEYIGLDTKFDGGIQLHDKVYTYAYNNDSHENSADPVAGASVTKYPGASYTGPAYTNSSPNTLPGTGEGLAKPGINDDDPGGRIKVNSYRAVGDYLALTHGEDTSLEEQVGVWTEYERAVRYAYLLDYSPQYLAANPQDSTYFGAFDPWSSKGSPQMPGYQWFMHLYNKTFQPYVDLIWKPLPNLSIEGGVKDSNFTIDLEAPVNQGTLGVDFTNNTYSKVQPYLDATYYFTPYWTAYAQVAEGIAYPIVTDEENVPSDAKDSTRTYNPGNLKEEETVNFQVGSVYKTARFNGDIDVYLININNIVSSVVDPNDSTNTLYFQSKGAWLSGVEAEGTYYLGAGVSAYANGSLEEATYKTNPGVPSFAVGVLGAFGGGGVPKQTAALGVVYNHEGWFASLEGKYVGDWVVYSSALVNPDLGLNGQTSTGLAGGTPTPVRAEDQGGWGTVNFSGGYAWKLPSGGFLHSIKVKLEIDNLTDRKVQVLNSVGASAASDTFNVLPTTSYFITVSTEF